MRIVVSFYRTGSSEVSQRIFLDGISADKTEDPITKEEYRIISYNLGATITHDKWRAAEVIRIELF